MNVSKREKIQRILRHLAASHAATMELMEETLKLLNEELALDATTFWNYPITAARRQASKRLPRIDGDMLQVHFRGKTCSLGNTLPFRFLQHLLRCPNKYFTYEELLHDVWDGRRSDAAVRSVVKRLRVRLKREGMSELANAIDGSHSGRYALRINI
jgi:DNA-binding response OmpR family regulator